MTCSVSGQDELNSALWLATREGNTTLSYVRRITRCVPQEKNVLYPCRQRVRWLNIGSFFPCVLCPSRSLKKELGQYPAILIPRLVNNPNLLYGQLRERASWTKSCAVIGYPSGQDGAILPARDYPPRPARNISQKSHIINPLLTKLVRTRWLDIGLVLFLRVCGPRLRLGPQKRKKRTWPISSHLDLTLGQ